MAKKKKTRKQKILADTRHDSISHRTQTVASLAKDNPTDILPGHATSPQILTTEYNFLYLDLRKTIFLTTAIIAAEILIKNLFLGAH